MSAEEEFKANVQDIFYAYDAYDVSPEAQGILSKDAAYFNSHPNVRIVIGGYCDERGSTEYNLALGDRRAQAAKDFMVSLGVPADRMQTISYGKEKPFCNEHAEACWQQNRRAHIAMAK